MADKIPTILVLDAVDATAKALLGINGIRGVSGSLGSPYAVPLGSGMCIIDTKDVSLPDYKEADGFVIDLRELKNRQGVSPEQPPDHVEKVFTSGLDECVDPRPYLMWLVREDCDRILRHGGVFVIFARPIQTIQYVSGHLEYGGHNLKTISRHDASNYSFLTDLLFNLTIESDHGKEMSPVAGDSPLHKLIVKHLNGGSYSCTFRDQTSWKNWTPLAVNKFRGCVAAVRRFNDAGGLVLLLPTLNDEATFVISLFREVLPELRPSLFPDLQRGTWALKSPYEMDAVLQLQSEVTSVQEAAARQVEQLREKIDSTRVANAYLFELVRGTGDSLVNAVKIALADLGAQDVLDVDEQMKAEQDDPALREDLQIRDRSPLLTVDVKGLLNLPGDDDALQSHKHASIRVQEYERLDIRALSIINHQRTLPPLERDIAMPFRDELLKAAAHLKVGMLTAWDLHRLVRNTKKWGWRPEDVLPVLYRVGRIEPIPEHYTLVGTVEHFYEKPQAASISLTSGILHRGDRIAFEFPVEFYEMQADSLQVNKVNVDEAPFGSLCGVVTPFHRNELSIGTRVYRIRV
jgi:hypothetical protein